MTGVQTCALPILPKRNEKNLLEDVPSDVREAMTMHLVGSIDEALGWALEGTPATSVAALVGDLG